MSGMELMNVLSVGGNPVSAFLSWRLQATNACDVTLVWKSGYDHVAQYGISFKSPVFGNERFKPRHVVKTPEEAASRKEGAFDYVILCIKALPDVYDLASVIDSVVTPQHTCILVNTTHTLGVESALEERFPTNVVLSLVCGAELTQQGQSEFEHKGSMEIWVGPANKNANIPASIQDDMAQALAMTLSTGQVDCKVSPNIRQQQYERVIGPIAFHPASVVFETPDHSELLNKIGVSELISDIIDEMLTLANAQGCKFPSDFKQKVIEEMCSHPENQSIMWQDFTARRPMEVETHLGSPIKLAQEYDIKLPRIETMYAILHNLNITNRQRPKVDSGPPNGLPPPPGSPTMGPPPFSRMSSGQPGPGPRLSSNGNGMPPPRTRPRGSSNLGPPPPGMRRPMPPMNGGGPNGYGRPPMNGPNGYPRSASRRGSMDGNDLEEFSHLVVYDDIPEGGEPGYSDGQSLAFRERELQLRQRELALREQEMRMRRGGGGGGGGPQFQGPPRRGGPSKLRNGAGMFDDEDDDDDYFDPNAPSGPPIDPDNFDMMSVTSRKNRKGPPPSQGRMNGEFDSMPARNSRYRPSISSRNRSSQIVNSVAGVHDNILDDPLMSFTSNRYGNVDRGALHHESRANSLTTARLDEFQYGPGQGGGGGGGGPPMDMNGGGFPRRSSQSPGNPYSPSIRGGNGRPSPPNGYGPPVSYNGRPSPPNGGVQQPVPRYPPGQGNSVAPQQVEQHVGVSSLQPPMGKNVRSLTGSASASAGSGDSTNLDSEPSAHSSQISLGQRPPIGVR